MTEGWVGDGVTSVTAFLHNKFEVIAYNSIIQ
jgi:hypothetical protein